MAKTIDVQLFNAFFEAAVESLELMANLKIQRKNLFIKPDDQLHGDIYGVIGLSQGMVGNCAVAVTNHGRASARKLIW